MFMTLPTEPVPTRKRNVQLKVKLAAVVLAVAFVWKTAQAFYVVDIVNELLRPTQPGRSLPQPLHPLVQLASSKSVPTDQKVRQLQTFLNDDSVLLSERLTVAKRYMDKRSRVAGAEKVYAPFLIQEVLKSGRDFCRKTSHRVTPIGEYAFLSNGFEGYDRADFVHFKDKRVIPVLRQCLYAPDTIFGKDQGCLIRGLPWQSNGRNTGRQHIPIALARLGATDAVPDLKYILKSHHDPYLRSNAAYALGALMNRSESRETEAYLHSLGNASGYLYQFGAGLITRGEAEGLKYVMQDDKPSSQYSSHPRVILYKLQRRLQAVRGFQSKAGEDFYRFALETPEFRNIFLDKPMFWEAKVHGLDPAVGEYRNFTQRIYDPLKEQVYAELLEGVERNGFDGLQASITEIAEKTKDSKIASLSQETLARLDHGDD